MKLIGVELGTDCRGGGDCSTKHAHRNLFLNQPCEGASEKRTFARLGYSNSPASLGRNSFLSRKYAPVKIPSMLPTSLAPRLGMTLMTSQPVIPCPSSAGTVKPSLSGSS